MKRTWDDFHLVDQCSQPGNPNIQENCAQVKVPNHCFSIRLPTTIQRGLSLFLYTPGIKPLQASHLTFLWSSQTPQTCFITSDGSEDAPGEPAEPPRTVGV